MAGATACIPLRPGLPRIRRGAPPPATTTTAKTELPSMSERKNLCVLVALHHGNQTLAERIGEDEARHAAERCANRIERAVAAHGGKVLSLDAGRTVAVFDSTDAGVQAASEALQRIRNLPPLRGTRQPVRLGLHHGAVENLEVDAAEPAGEGMEVALRLAGLCEDEQALASGTVAMLAGSASRALMSTQALSGPNWANLGWLVFGIGHRTDGGAVAPPAARPSQRLRIRHQQGVQFVDESRPVLLLGRERANDVTIMDPRASRQHARIECRREGFVLFDQSTNGTYVALEGQGDHHLKQDHLLLSAPGRIGCGFSADEVERDLVFFDIV